MYVIYEGKCNWCNWTVTVGLQGNQTDSADDFPTGDNLKCPACTEPFNVWNRKVVNVPEWEDEVTALLDDNEFVGAIKVWRENTGASLRDGKAAVEALPAYAAMRAREV